MINYLIKRNFKGSPDGMTVRLYQKGEIVTSRELGSDLTQIAKKEKWISKTKKVIND